jgi:hypothetical protein
MRGPGRQTRQGRTKAAAHRVTKYLRAALLAASAMCSGMGPSTASIMARCSRFSCVWYSASPAAHHMAGSLEQTCRQISIDHPQFFGELRAPGTARRLQRTTWRILHNLPTDFC